MGGPPMRRSYSAWKGTLPALLLSGFYDLAPPGEYGNQAGVRARTFRD